MPYFPLFFHIPTILTILVIIITVTVVDIKIAISCFFFFIHLKLIEVDINLVGKLLQNYVFVLLTDSSYSFVLAISTKFFDHVAVPENLFVELSNNLPLRQMIEGV